MSNYMNKARKAETEFVATRKAIDEIQRGPAAYANAREVSALQAQALRHRDTANFYAAMATAEFLEELIKMRGTNG